MSYAIRNLNVQVDDEVHLQDINLDLPDAGVVTIVGRTLAGKTTFLKVLAGLQETRSGTLERDGKNLLDIPAWQRRVGMVYQQFVNYPHLNVRENIVFPLRRAKLDADTIAAKLEYASTLLGLTDYLDRNPSELSGGQQQRVALARSLVKDTDFLLLDEPLVNLDYKLREQLREEFRRLFKDSKDRLVVYATTEPQEAMILQGYVVILHEGRVVQTGNCSEVYHYPANTITAQIFSDPPMNLLDGEILADQIRIGKTLTLSIPEHLKKLDPERYVFGIRAMDMTLDGKAAMASLVLAEVNGSSTVLHLDMDGANLVLEIEGVHQFDDAQKVHFSLDASRIYAFDPKTGDLAAAPVRETVSSQGGEPHGQD